MNNQQFIEKTIINDLIEKLNLLSGQNVDNILRPTALNNAIKVKEILNSNYFSSTPIRYDGILEYMVMQKNGLLKITSELPYALLPVPNTRYFYCRCSVTEGSMSMYDQILPSRDCGIATYEWENLFNASDIYKAFALMKKRHEMNLQNTIPIDYRVHFFGLLKDPQRSYTQIIHSENAIDFFNSADRAYKLCESEEFEYISIHPLSDPKIVLDNAKQYKHKASENSSIKRKKTYVVFVDTLDTSIFSNKSIMQKLPNLKRIRKNSILYNGFTSSGFWTYPCLHSLHTGLPPYYSASFIKITPSELIQVSNISELGSTHKAFIHCAYNNSNVNPVKLTTRLRDNGINSISLKTSCLASTNWNLQEGISFGIDNCTIDLLSGSLKILSEAVENNYDVCFIDIDTLHRGPLFFKRRDKDWSVNELDFLKPKQSKIDRLLGKVDNYQESLMREMSQLIKVDEVLGQILDQINPEDNLILFSDNGSQNHKANFEFKLNLPYGTSATLEKIWQPTLLVSTSDSKYNDSMSSNELVSTSDLYSIILSLYDQNTLRSESQDNSDRYYDSIVPPSLGGERERTACITFGANGLDSNILEVVCRKKNNEGWCAHKEIKFYGKNWTVDNLMEGLLK